jgi:predicted enzyme related to lactoylglutathione lyase
MSYAPHGDDGKAESPEPFCNVTWRATDLERTKSFLSNLFGWSFAPQGESDHVFTSPSGGFVSLCQVERIERGTPFLPQIPVTDLSAVLAEAKKLGDIVVEEGEVPGVARYADLRDPDGTLFSVLEFRRPAGA